MSVQPTPIKTLDAKTQVSFLVGGGLGVLSHIAAGRNKRCPGMPLGEDRRQPQAWCLRGPAPRPSSRCWFRSAPFYCHGPSAKTAAFLSSVSPSRKITEPEGGLGDVNQLTPGLGSLRGTQLPPGPQCPFRKEAGFWSQPLDIPGRQRKCSG